MKTTTSKPTRFPSPMPLIRRARRGDQQAWAKLLARYTHYMHYCINKLGWIVKDPDDRWSCAMGGLTRAVSTYDPAKSQFTSLLWLAIQRTLQTRAVYERELCRKAERPVLGLVDCHEIADEETDTAFAALDSADEARAIWRDLKQAWTPFERWAWLKVYVQGQDYDTAAAELGTTRRGIDNAVQRARLKASTRCA